MSTTAVVVVLLAVIAALWPLGAYLGARRAKDAGWDEAVRYLEALDDLVEAIDYGSDEEAFQALCEARARLGRQKPFPKAEALHVGAERVGRA